MTYKYQDKLGTEIKVGDILVYGCGTYADIYTGIVTKRNPATVQVNGVTSVNMGQCLVITEMFKSQQPQHYQDLYDKYKDRFKDDGEKRTVCKYGLLTRKNKTTGKYSLLLTVTVNGDTLPFKDLVNPEKDWDNYGKCIARSLEKRDGRWVKGLTDNLLLTHDYVVETRQKDLPAKIIKSLFNGVPTDSQVIETFDNETQLEFYLTQLGVQV